MLKKTTNRKTIAITVLAVLLVALLAFNVTYAYFTDQTQSDVTMTFGIVDIQADGLAVKLNGATTGYAMPGDTIGLKGTITATNTTGEIWVRIAVPTDKIRLFQAGSPDEELVFDPEKGDTDSAAVTNKYYDGTVVDGVAVDGTTYTYTNKNVNDMKVQFSSLITTQIGGLLSTIDGDGVVEEFNSDGIGKVNKNLNLDLSTATGTITLNIAQFGNLWQNVKVQFTVTIQAIQADGVANATAAKALFENTDLDFDTGILTA